MSDEQRKDEPEVEGHRRAAASDEPSDDAMGEDEVEGHVRRFGASDEPSDETAGDDEVEAHVRRGP